MAATGLPPLPAGLSTMTPALLLLVAFTPGQLVPLEKAWYSPHELLPLLASRDGIQWAMPETIAGRAWVGGDVSTKAALDAACKQWGLSSRYSNGVIVVHREHPKLKEWSEQL